MDRHFVNALKTDLLERMNYILKVYESIEEESQYDAFIAMCDRHLQHCQFWLDNLKPKWYNVLSGSRKLYKHYYDFAQHTLNVLQAKISEYHAAVKEAMEEQDYYDAIRKKIEIEFYITKELQDNQYNEIRKEEHRNKIGFAYGGKTKKPRRRSNKHNKQNE